MKKMPDFIIIGAMKCATSTLHDQLSKQSGIFMTVPKEPFFFSNDEVWAKGGNWYSGLFRAALENDLCGESSTHYTKLPTYPMTVSRMRTMVPHAKLIYIIRHPIDRLISHYIHLWTEKETNLPIDSAIQSCSELIEYSKYAMQIRPFLETYGTANLLLVFFEHLLSDPQRELSRICHFIGYKGTPQWKSLDASNVSSQRLRKSRLRDLLVWNPVSNWFRRAFVPQSLRDRVKGIWQMKQRPEICEKRYLELELIFNNDLNELSRWIDKDLSCQTFKAVAKSSMPEWTHNTSL